MARMPSVADLGPAPQVQGDRPIGRPDATPIAIGAEKIGAGVSRLGQGIDALGKGLDNVITDKQRADYFAAHADFLSRSIDLQQKYANDQDYATLPDRYKQDVKDLQTDAGARIDNPFMRNRFTEATNVNIAEGNARMAQHAHMLEGNANVAYVDQQGDKFIDQATANPNDHTLPNKVAGAYGDLVDGLQGRGFLTPEQGLARKRDFTHRFALASGLSRAESDPYGVLNELRTAPGSPEQIDNRIAEVEGYSKNAASSATGTGQFIKKTWLDLMRANHPEFADKSDADVLAMRADRGLGMEMLGKLREQNTGILTRNGVEANAGNIYLAHFLGPAGAVAVAQAKPGQPVADVLAKAVGPETAQQMIAANPGVLRGQTAGSVAQWANERMGGVGPEGGHAFDLLRPDQRAVLEEHALRQLHQRQASDVASFHNSVQDDVAQSWQTGSVANPKTQGDFIQRYGAEKGGIEYRNYLGDLQLGQDRQKVVMMTPEQQRDLYQSYAPTEDEPGYADKLKRQMTLGRAIDAVNKERADDPANYVVRNVPGVSDLYGAIGQGTTPEARQVAARDYATRVLMEQRRFGVPEDFQRLVPKGYTDAFTARLGRPAPKDGTVDIAGQIRSERELWGDNWPLIQRHIAKGASPTVEVMANGVTDKTGEILNEVGSIPLATILKDEDTEKSAAVRKEALAAMKPLMGSMLNDQGAQRVFDVYRGQAEKLTAWYVEHGDTARAGAQKAFEGLLGHQYDFSNGYRVPKGINVTPDQVAAGAVEAMRRLPEMDIRPDASRQGAALSADYLGRSSLAGLQRDGKWVSVSGDKGLALLDHDGKPVVKRDGSEVMLTWDQLGAFARDAGKRPAEPYSGVQP